MKVKQRATKIIARLYTNMQNYSMKALWITLAFIFYIMKTYWYTENYE